MAAIIRVKRPYSVEPQEALLIACKKARIDENETVDATPLTALVKFAGTVQNQDEDVVEHVTKNFSKEHLEKSFKKHNVDILSKLKEEMKQKSLESRYKIINHFRSLSDTTTGSDKGVTTIIDIEDSTVVNKTNKDEENYVYDLYYTNDGNDMEYDQLISVHPIEHELVYQEDSVENDYNDESEDSNSESNWRNDYPDESDHESLNEDDMREAMENMNLSELSSDDEELCYELNAEHLERYGHRYAKYKAIMDQRLGELASDDDNSENSENSDAIDTDLSDVGSENEEP